MRLNALVPLSSLPVGYHTLRTDRRTLGIHIGEKGGDDLMMRDILEMVSGDGDGRS